MQIRFQPNDHKTIKETADELKIFEGIKHPNLVRYFGVELHRVRKYQLWRRGAVYRAEKILRSFGSLEVLLQIILV